MNRDPPAAQAGQLRSFIQGQTGTVAAIDLDLDDPAPERLVGDPEFHRDGADGVAQLVSEPDSHSPELGWIGGGLGFGTCTPSAGLDGPNCQVSTKPGASSGLST